MKRKFTLVLTALLAVVLVVMGAMAFMDVGPFAVDGPEAAAVLTLDVAPAEAVPVTLTLADAVAAPDAVDASLIYVVYGLSALGPLTLLTILAMRSRSSGRQVSGCVRSLSGAIV